MSNNITVVYLLRKAPDAWNAFQQFLGSIRRYPAGVPYDLLILIKGFDETEALDWMQELAVDPSEIRFVPDANYDLGSYYVATKHITTEYVLFLNSYSFATCSYWLKLFQDASVRCNSLLVGSTGSYESFGFNLPLLQRAGICSWLLWSLRCCQRLIQSFRLGWRVGTFPNRHIRTNAFFTKVTIYSDYFSTRKLPQIKIDCHLVESGPDSFTNFVNSLGLNPGVLESTGRFLSLNELHLARGFRRGDQSTLIFCDNRTTEFAKSSPSKRLSMEWDAWRELH